MKAGVMWRGVSNIGGEAIGNQSRRGGRRNQRRESWRRKAAWRRHAIGSAQQRRSSGSA